MVICDSSNNKEFVPPSKESLTPEENNQITEDIYSSINYGLQKIKDEKKDFIPLYNNQNIQQIINENNLLRQKIMQLNSINQQQCYEIYQMKLYFNNLQMMLLNQIQIQQNNNFNNQSFLNMYFAQQFQNNINWNNGQIKKNTIIFRFENEYMTVSDVSPGDRLRNIFNIMCTKVKLDENKKYCDLNKIYFIHNCKNITNYFLNDDEVGILNFNYNPEIFLLKKRHVI